MRLYLPLLLLAAACASPPAKVPADANAPIKGGYVAPEPGPAAAQTSMTQMTSAEMARPSRGGPVTASADPDANENREDRATSARVRKQLMNDPALKKIELDRIRITNDGGKITLNGLVPTTADKVEIETSARSVKGVTGVDNQIEELH